MPVSLSVDLLLGGGSKTRGTKGTHMNKEEHAKHRQEPEFRHFVVNLP